MKHSSPVSLQGQAVRDSQSKLRLFEDTLADTLNVTAKSGVQETVKATKALPSSRRGLDDLDENVREFCNRILNELLDEMTISKPQL